jgi:hypothetical protein
MKNAELLNTLGAKRIPRGRGKKPTISVLPIYKGWADKHQHLIRHAFAHPENDITLVAHETDETLRALNFDTMTLANGITRFFHPAGDEVGDTILLMDRAQALANASEIRRHAEREYFAILHGKRLA